MSEIIDIAEARRRGDASVGLLPRRSCTHRRIDVAPDSAEILCRDCHAPLNAHDILLEYANGERIFLHLRTERAKLSEEIEKLKAEEKRIKARIRRASAKVTP